MQLTQDMRIGALPSRAELEAAFEAKYGGLVRMGPMQRLWRRVGYFAPDDWYETTVTKLVFPGCEWLDVGCGRNVFPDNPPLAQELAARSSWLVGVDPDETIHENLIVHERVQSTIDALRLDRTFDVVTLRMVAEHITDPSAAIDSLARLCRPSGLVVVCTPNQWSPVSFAARVVPHALHAPIKRWLWCSDAKDTFPVAYRMNTRRQLSHWFEQGGFHEVAFAKLDDCRALHRIWWLHRIELALRGWCAAFGLSYPENCLLGVYQRLSGNGR